jgi:cyclophilin family peptidyl-prolyl cis-trans isomerase
VTVAAAGDRKGPAGPAMGDERVVLHTNRGHIVFGPYDGVTPKHAAQIRKPVRIGVYNTSSVFRVEPGYLAQVTDAPSSRRDR